MLKCFTNREWQRELPDWCGWSPRSFAATSGARSGFLRRTRPSTAPTAPASRQIVVQGALGRLYRAKTAHFHLDLPLNALWLACVGRRGQARRRRSVPRHRSAQRSTATVIDRRGTQRLAPKPLVLRSFCTKTTFYTTISSTRITWTPSPERTTRTTSPMTAGPSSTTGITPW